ncbi:MAG: hypothetical protein WBP29_11240 [Candidatus Zixiibacteriota bacterium]
MSVLKRDVRFYGAATNPDDDTTEDIGGAIDTAIKVTWGELSAAVELKAVSSNAGDTTQTVTITGRTASGAKVTEVITLNGTTPAQAGTPKTFARTMKAIKSATCAGDVALMSNTATRSNTATGGGVDADGNPYIDLDAGASATDDIYKGEVVRVTSGTGAGELNEGVRYDGAAKRLYVRNDWGTAPASGSGFELAKGMFFEKAPSEIMECRRIHFDEAANALGGADKDSYDKVFIKNTHATLALSNAVVSEVVSGISTKETFALDAAVNGTTTNGAGNNRNVAPAGTFDSADKAVPGGNLEPGDAIGVWCKLTLADGDAAQNSFYELQCAGTTT